MVIKVCDVGSREGQGLGRGNGLKTGAAAKPPIWIAMRLTSFRPNACGNVVLWQGDEGN